MPDRAVDLVLVNPGDAQGVYQGLAADLTAVEPPVWAGLMAGYARRMGWTVAVVDANAERLSPVETARRVANLDPVLTAVVAYGHQPSASTQVMPAARAVLQAVRDSGVHTMTLLVGGHVAALPERTLREEPVDYVATGEGLATIHQLLREYGRLRDVQFRLRVGSVPGLVYWDGDSWDQWDSNVQRTPEVFLTAPLDSTLPAVAWDLLPMGKYRAHNWHCLDGSPRTPYAALYTTLGCPYQCTFCCIQAPFRDGQTGTANAYRFWSPAAVVAQIDTLVNHYGVRNIKIADEMFVLNQGHVMGICDLLIQRGYDLNLWAYGRVDTIRPAWLDKLRRAGFRWLALGIEAGDPAVRDGVGKGYATETIYKAIEQTRAAGINVVGNYIFGLPQDTMETMQATLDLALDLRCEWANFYCAMAYPGSELYNKAVAAAWELPKTWGGYSQHSPDTMPLGTATLPGSEVVRFRDQAFRRYFTDPHYLGHIRGKFGIAGVEAVQSMLAVKLRREEAPQRVG